MEKTRCSGYRLHHEMLYLNVRKKFFIVREIFHWNNLLWDVTECPSLEVFNTRLDRVTDNFI